jgi:hypothetical protein
LWSGETDKLSLWVAVDCVSGEVQQTSTAFVRLVWVEGVLASDFRISVVSGKNIAIRGSRKPACLSYNQSKAR